jgi:hypothetical protein
MRAEFLKYARTRTLLWGLGTLAAVWPTMMEGATQIRVPGSANPWLAGMPDGSTAARGGLDIAPADSPVQVLGLDLLSGSLVSFRASGFVDALGAGGNLFGPDGSSFGGWRNAENGISGTTNNHSVLVGVFLGDDRPDTTPAPADTVFLPSPPTTHQDYTVYVPELKQVFFIGDGLTTAGLQQHVVVPNGATRLFVGVVDMHNQNHDNSGFFEVTVIPEPRTVTLFGALGGFLLWSARRRRL